MREWNECREEVFRRSAQRIAKRRSIRNRIMMCGIPVCLAVLMALPLTRLPDNAGLNENNALYPDNVTGKPAANGVLDIAPDVNGTPSGNDGQNVVLPSAGLVGNVGNNEMDGFSFALTWDCYGISSYDSATGKLVKTKDTTNPEDFVTCYQLTDAQKLQIYDLIMGLDVTSYPDVYNPQLDGVASSPTMTLILTVRTATIDKTITAAGIAMSYESKDSKGQKLLSVCKTIQDILVATDEWKALPEYEAFYD